MVTTWLNLEERDPCPYSCFKVIDVQESGRPSERVKLILRGRLQAALFDPNFLNVMAEYLGWDRVKGDIVTQKVPTVPSIRKGDFGEALMATMLEDFRGYKIPVPKLRFKIRGNQTLPATDFLALKIDTANSIIEV